MHALSGLDVALGGDREFHTERARRRAIVRPAPIAEIDDPDEAERPQHSVIEAATIDEIAYAKRDMVEHNDNPRNERPADITAVRHC
jgi:hypothetical protein